MCLCVCVTFVLSSIQLQHEFIDLLLLNNTKLLQTDVRIVFTIEIRESVGFNTRVYTPYVQHSN